MSDARERLARVIHGLGDGTDWASTPVERELDDADAVIAHLWQRASDPDCDAMAIMNTYIKDARDYLSVAPEVIAEDAITALMTQLIGPRPEGADDE